MPQGPVVDGVALERLLRIGGQPFLLEMIELFLEHAPQRLAAARVGLSHGDREALYAAAHSLKSTAGNLGARPLQDAAARLESRAAVADPTELEAVLEELERCYDAARDRLQAERRRRRGEA